MPNPAGGWAHVRAHHSGIVFICIVAGPGKDIYFLGDDTLGSEE